MNFRICRLLRSRILVGSALALIAGTIVAAEPLPFSGEFTGDWFGVRRTLREDGVDIQLSYVSETASNVKSDVKTRVLYTDQYTFGMTLDLEKLLNIKEGQFQGTITDRNGQNLSSAANLNTLQLVQEVYGRGQTWLITQFWYRQQFFSDSVDWKIGKMTTGEDFATIKCDFMNLTFCGSPPGLLVSDYWYNWPLSVWASRVKIALEDSAYIELGGYEVNPKYQLQRYAFTLAAPPGATGALLPLEVGWLPLFGSAHLQGSYKSGAWYDTSTSKDVVNNVNGQPLLIAGGEAQLHHGRYGGYVDLLQQLTHIDGGTPNGGLSVFANATAADRRTAFTDNIVTAGVLYSGMFVSRPTDDIALAVGRTHVNGRVTQSEQLLNVAGLGPSRVQTSEYVSEAYYSLHATPWLVLRADFQYIHQPDGVRQRTNDIVLGLKLVLDL